VNDLILVLEWFALKAEFVRTELACVTVNPIMTALAKTVRC
jgi:hypothetical protein